MGCLSGYEVRLGSLGRTAGPQFHAALPRHGRQHSLHRRRAEAAQEPGQERLIDAARQARCLGGQQMEGAVAQAQPP